jgi:hypothetical protein
MDYMLTADEIIKNAGVGAYAAATTTPGPMAEILAFLSSWQALAGMALVVSSVLLAFLYIFSVLFRNENLKNFVKLEISELFITALIISLLIGGVGALGQFKYASLVPASAVPAHMADANVYNVTETYFRQVGSDMAQWLELNYILGVYVDSLASVTPYARPLGVGLVASPLAGLASPFKQLLYNMSVALSIAYIINFAQLYVFLFAIAGSLHYYLPFGVILRSFTPTRRIGGALIGLSVSFLFIFPALYSFNYMMFYSDDQGPMVTFRNFLDYNMGEDGGGDKDPERGLFREDGEFENFYRENQSAGFIDLVVEKIGDLGRLFTSVIGKFFTMMMVIPLATIGRAFALGFILPAFNTMLMIQATKYISKTIGEEVDISTLTRLI